MKRLKVLDVCAGTGSATQAFRDRGHGVETLGIVGNHTYVRQKTESFLLDRSGRKNRATVPYGLSLAICKAIEREMGIL